MKKGALDALAKTAERPVNKGLQQNLTGRVSKKLTNGKPTLSIH
jgi:hypothetical protein